MKYDKAILGCIILLYAIIIYTIAGTIAAGFGVMLPLELPIKAFKWILCIEWILSFLKIRIMKLHGENENEIAKSKMLQFMIVNSLVLSVILLIYTLCTL